jgi:regulator of protease activity HflC (stomatin/prohibitin superfamily)
VRAERGFAQAGGRSAPATASRKEEAMRNVFKLATAGLAVLVVVSLAFANVFIVDEGDRVLIIRLGKMDRVLEPGLHLKTPFVEDRVTFSVRVQRVQYEGRLIGSMPSTARISSRS